MSKLHYAHIAARFLEVLVTLAEVFRAVLKDIGATMAGMAMGTLVFYAQCVWHIYIYLLYT